MNTAALKTQAKERMKAATPNVYIVYLIFSVIYGALIGIDSALSNGESSPTALAAILSIIISVSLVFTSTFIMLWFKGVFNNDCDMKKIWEFIKANFIQLFLLIILVSIITCIGYMILIVPGIILSLGLSFCVYCFYDDSSLGAVGALKKSWEMMKGHKMEYLVLMLSFIPWFLLCVVTCGIATIYVTPYFYTTIAGYYESLK